jgi:hypothetical protein
LVTHQAQLAVYCTEAFIQLVGAVKK